MIGLQAYVQFPRPRHCFRSRGFLRRPGRISPIDVDVITRFAVCPYRCRAVKEKQYKKRAYKSDDFHHAVSACVNRRSEQRFRPSRTRRFPASDFERRVFHAVTVCVKRPKPTPGDEFYPCDFYVTDAGTPFYHCRATVRATGRPSRGLGTSRPRVRRVPVLPAFPTPLRGHDPPGVGDLTRLPGRAARPSRGCHAVTGAGDVRRPGVARVRVRFSAPPHVPRDGYGRPLVAVGRGQCWE